MDAKRSGDRVLLNREIVEHRYTEDRLELPLRTNSSRDSVNLAAADCRHRIGKAEVAVPKLLGENPRESSPLGVQLATASAQTRACALGISGFRSVGQTWPARVLFNFIAAAR